MRKVMYKKWIPKQSELVDGKYVTINGTGCFEPDFCHEGNFHQWGNSFEEFESGPGNMTVALVENPDGTISEIWPPNIKFV